MVERVSADDKNVWIFAHNLNFDLTVSQLPYILTGRQFSVDAYGLSKESNWWVLKRDGHKVTIADSWSWCNDSLDTLAKDIGRRKVPLPGTGATMEEWHKRCRIDAEILTQVIVTLMDWWDRAKLGRWSITGAGCGWQAMRTLTGRKRIVVGPDSDRTPFERQAIFGGRKEVFRVGELSGEWCADYDFVGAYPSVVAHHRMPMTPGKWYDQIPDAIQARRHSNSDYIAEVTITTDRPVAPVKIMGDVWWPTGTFRTTLAGPEIDYARSKGAIVTIHGGYVYRMEYALRPWAIWVLGLLNAPSGDVPPLVRRLAKGWSRSVIGRFAGHSSQITSQRASVGSGWRLETGHNITTGRRLEVLTMGDTEITTEHDLDGAECFPAVLAFVESHCRVALATMLDSRAPSRVLQCNTDGWWERKVVRDHAYQLEDVPWPHRVVRKACVNQVRILGPDHLITSHERRLAGVPKNATAAIDLGYEWHDWPGLAWQLERNADASYLRPKKELQLSASYCRRWVLDNGETVAVTTDIDSTQSTYIVSWSRTLARRNTDTLAAYQDERLMSLNDSDTAPPVIFDTLGPSLPGRGSVNPVDLGGRFNSRLYRSASRSRR
jgi:hypothetical protein